MEDNLKKMEDDLKKMEDDEGLKYLRMDKLEKRREILCLKFAEKFTTNEKVSQFFPKRKSHHKMKKRKTEKYMKNKARTKRYQNSAIPYMQKLLNKDDSERNLILKILALSSYLKLLYPVNYELLSIYTCKSSITVYK